MHPMKLFAAAVIAAILSVSPAAAEGKVTIRWHGQSFFEIITSKGTRIVTDPHAIDAYGRIHVQADLVLISHLHSDHTQVGVIDNKDKAKIIYGLKVVNQREEWNPVDETFRDVKVRSLGVYHDTMQGMERGKNTIFIIDVDGMHIVFLGDLGHLLDAGQIRQIGPVDVLMIPIGGVYTINGSDAKTVVKQLKPTKYIIPMHYGTDVFEDLLGPDEFLEDQKNVKKFPGNNELVVDPNFKPAEPVIALLYWRKGARDDDK
jgi:L-ascorbate metabolism protein UlaG (beta-lactamase superfamily)